MKYYNLDDQEKQILEDYEADQFESVTENDKVNEQMRQYAKQTLRKTKNINIRLSAKDIQKLKAKAVEVGVPYQTLISATLHQLANKKNASLAI